MRTLPLTSHRHHENWMYGVLPRFILPWDNPGCKQIYSEQKLPFRNQAWGFGATKSGLPRDWDDYTFFFEFHSNRTLTDCWWEWKRLLYNQALVIIQPRNFAPPYTLHKAQIKKEPPKTCTCILTATLTLATEATQCHPWLEIGGVACSTRAMQCHWP